MIINFRGVVCHEKNKEVGQDEEVTAMGSGLEDVLIHILFPLSSPDPFVISNRKLYVSFRAAFVNFAVHTIQ